MTNVPLEFSLSQNYPNPFNPATKITYQLPKASHVTIKVYDIIGNEIKTIVNQQAAAGEYSVDFNAYKYGSGVYFYQMQAGNFIEIKKMILMK